jgi:hypothetical protein
LAVSLFSVLAPPFPLLCPAIAFTMFSCNAFGLELLPPGSPFIRIENAYH